MSKKSKIIFLVLSSYMIISLLYCCAQIVHKFDTKRIHPKSNYAIEKLVIDGTMISYHLSLVELPSYEHFEPNLLSMEGIQGIQVEGEDLYIEISKEIYYIDLSLGMVKRLESVPPHIKLIKPEIFWKCL